MKKKDEKDMAELIERLRAGSPEAQRVFFAAYLPQLCAITTHILGDPLRAEEVAVEVMGDFLLRHVQSLEIAAAAPAYMRIMAIRKARKFRAQKYTELDLNPEHGADISLPDRMTEEAMCELLSPRLEHCLSKLKPKMRRILQLSYQAELSHKAIGDLIGASGQYVGRVVSQSLASLKRCLQLEGMMRGTKNRAEGRSMNAEALLNQVLKLHYQPEAEAFCVETERIAAVAEGLANSEQAQAAHCHLGACADCRQDFQTMLQLKAARIFAGGVPRLAIRPGHSLRNWSMAAAVLVALSVSLGAYLGLDQRPEEPYSMVAKGETEALEVAVQRGIQRFHLRSEDRLLPGDRIGYFYTAHRDGYLMVLDVQQDAGITVLHPVGESQSAAIAAGTQVSLADGGVVEASQGCGWIIALFSDAPLTLAEIQKHVNSAVGNQRDCRLTLPVPHTRTVWVQVINE